MNQPDLFAGVASTVMHRPSKPAQAGSIPVARSSEYTRGGSTVIGQGGRPEGSGRCADPVRARQQVMVPGGCGRRPGVDVAHGAHDPASAADPHSAAVPREPLARAPAHASASARGNSVEDGRGKRDTSRAAYRAMRDAGQLAPREHEVYAYLCQHAEQDFTRAELAKALGRTHGAICGRIFALREYGLVVETARRQCAVTGSQSHGVRCK